MFKKVKWGLLSMGLLSLLFWLLLPNDVPTYSGILLVMSYILLAISILVILVSSLINLSKHPGSLKKKLFFVGSVLLAVYVCYFLTGDAPEGVSDFDSALVETGLYFFYLTAILAIGLMLFFALKRIVKK